MGPNKRLKALQQEKADLVQRMEAMLDAADKEGRDLTADEEKGYQELEASVPALDKRIKREQDFLNAQASQQPIRDLNRDTRQEAAARIGEVHDNWLDDPMCGYERPRDFLLDVIEDGQGGDITPQLRFLAAAESDEQGSYSDPHGGFFLPEGTETCGRARGRVGRPAHNGFDRTPSAYPRATPSRRPGVALRDPGLWDRTASP